jgi:cytochrome c556
MNNKLLLLLALSLMTAFSVTAHESATGIVKQRMDAMEVMSKQSKLLARIFKGKNDFSREQIVNATDSYLEHGLTMFDLFPDTPESRDQSVSEALPTIWQEPERFKQLSELMVERALSLKEAALSNLSIKVQEKKFLDVARTCKQCHKRYRQE